ncbi:energy-coupling factor transport system substrate-specific component [Enterococcus sp. PF1-24]|uniref:ECF transporter S component n=1 Tax=unclassified Enterococcus TaxID=2608891 RepID=UPI002472E8CB|nr:MULTISPECIES: ECF transporter S component [unclassified Enterococcus]MDH6365440.1 energy-coupling factor transport system substrate-specific component [Enterococcus sp. PFB1-1]MDH6402541.1 energy-coupling factor transport system substrate-specific component [Enterococcus sp. PF1-24]
MENSKKSGLFTVRDIGSLSLLTAACVVGRTAFQFVPNVQPITAIFLIVTLYKGFLRGSLLMVLTMLVTNFYMGMGVWTITQIGAYLGVIICVHLVGKIPIFRKSIVLQVVFAVFSGFLYGFLTAGISVPIYGIRAFWPYYLQGIYFDSLHALGNGIFYLMLIAILPKLFQRFWNE